MKELLHTIAQLESQLATCKKRSDWDNCAATARHIASLYDELREKERQK
jgi:hypothetical protein